MIERKTQDFLFGQLNGHQCYYLKEIVLEGKCVVGKPGMWENDEFSLKILLLKSIWTQKWRHWMAVGYAVLERK